MMNIEIMLDDYGDESMIAPTTEMIAVMIMTAMMTTLVIVMMTTAAAIMEAALGENSNDMAKHFHEVALARQLPGSSFVDVDNGSPVFDRIFAGTGTAAPAKRRA